MKRTLIGQLRLARKHFVTTILIILGGGLFGTVLFELIMRLEEVHDELPTTFEMAFFIAFVCYIVNFFGYGISGVNQSFNQVVGMGCTRKNFFIGHSLTCLINSLVGAATLMLVYVTEHWRLRAWWGAYPCETDFLSFATPGIVCFIVLALAVFQLFVSFVMLRFEKKAFWVFWALWMFGCLVVPRIVDDVEDGKQSALAKLGNFAIDVVTAIPAGTWLIIGSVITLGMYTISYFGFKRQHVTV